MNEEWKDVSGYEGLYKVSNTGKVLSVRRNALLVPQDNGNGYKYVSLGASGRAYIHRLVAEHFLPDRNDGDVVNHIDFNRSNNAASNLEWLTPKENVRYSSARMRHEKSKCKKTNTGLKYIREYTSKGKYHTFRVMIRRLGVCKQFQKLEDAIRFRDEVMNGA